MTALIDTDYVAAMWGQDLPDTDRGDFLIGEASGLVIEHCAPTSAGWTATTAPTRVRQAVARLVISVLSAPVGDQAALKAEQIGDYRAEFIAGPPPMDLALVDGLLRPYRASTFSIVATVPMDGLS